jgi:tetratricopeptide (TPR) repeat protein
MDEYKVLDYIKFPMVSTHSEAKNTCFVVYSTKEEHVPNVIGAVEDVFKRNKSFNVVLLGEQVKSGDSQYGKLHDYLNTASFAIIILDGFRPNVLFEYGILIGLKKPCIVLLEKRATVDVKNYFEQDDVNSINNPNINIDKHFSDVKDRYYIVYDRNNLKKLKDDLEEQYTKLKNDIEKTVMEVLFPNLNIIQDELKDCILCVIQFSMTAKAIDIDELAFRVAVERIDHLAGKYIIPLSSMYYRSLADIYVKLGKHTEALTYINKAINTDRHDVESLLSKAFICAFIKDENSAMLTMNDAIKLDPASESLWHNKGLLFERFKKTEEAFICYEKALSCEGSCHRLHFNYSSILYEKNRNQEALDAINIALQLEAHNDCYILLKSLICGKMNQGSEALALAKEAISFNAGNADAWYRLGNLTEDKDEALIYYNKSLELDPKHHASLCSIGRILSSNGQWPEALDALTRVAELCGKVSDCSTLLIAIGTTKYLKNKTENLLDTNVINSVSEYFKRALPNASEKQKASCYNNLGYMQLLSGHYSDATETFKSAIALVPEPITYYNLSIAYTQQGYLEPALAILKNIESDLLEENHSCGCLISLVDSATLPFATEELIGKVNLLQETSKLIRLLEREISKKQG